MLPRCQQGLELGAESHTPTYGARHQAPTITGAQSHEARRNTHSGNLFPGLINWVITPASSGQLWPAAQEELVVVGISVRPFPHEMLFVRYQRRDMFCAALTKLEAR